MSADLLTQLALLVGAFASLFVYTVRRRAVFGATGAALVALSIDEAFSMHERLGRWFDQSGVDVPLVQDLDSLVLAAYGVVLATLFIAAWGPLTSAPLATAAMGGTFLLGGAAVAMDMLVPRGLPGAHGEEYLEAGAACGLACVFLSHAAAILAGSSTWRPALRRRIPDDVLPVLDHVTHGHALDDAAEGAGHAPG
jgi:hypothetical protein